MDVYGRSNTKVARTSKPLPGIPGDVGGRIVPVAPPPILLSPATRLASAFRAAERLRTDHGPFNQERDERCWLRLDRAPTTQRVAAPVAPASRGERASAWNPEAYPDGNHRSSVISYAGRCSRKAATRTQRDWVERGSRRRRRADHITPLPALLNGGNAACAIPAARRRSLANNSAVPLFDSLQVAESTLGQFAGSPLSRLRWPWQRSRSRHPRSGRP